MINIYDSLTGYTVQSYLSDYRLLTSEGYALEARRCLKWAGETRNKYHAWFWQMSAARYYQWAAEARAKGR